MQLIHDFNISPIQYYLNGKNNVFPVIERCPDCNDIMIKHGFYQRFVITVDGKSYLLFIRRYRCKHCNHTVSILPSFLLPLFQRSLKAIFKCLTDYFLYKSYFLNHRQVHIYCQRFCNNTPGIVSFFRETINSMLAFKEDGKKKAIKLIKMIKSFSARTFSQRFHNHFNKNFMAY